MRFDLGRSFRVAAVLHLPVAVAISLDVNDNASIKQAAKTIAYDMMTYYTGNMSSSPPSGPGSVGFLPLPYYWWEAGAMWGALVDYWHYTNDSSYNAVVSQALLSQASPKNDFMPASVMDQDGNDDQSFWALSVMSAAEHGFPDPPSSSPQWASLAIKVFNEQIARWDTATCGGGLKWQIFSSNAGYDYKNVGSNGALFQLSARLARYTGNQTYVEWAGKTWDWMSAIGLVDENFQVYDGSDDTLNCSRINRVQWSYNAGMVLYGVAVMSNYTNGSSIWMDRAISMLGATKPFFTPFPNASFVMFEVACETAGTCNTDQFSFKAYLSRWMAASAQMVPSLASATMDLLRPSAMGAAKSCSGGKNNTTCGEKWYVGSYDGSSGVGQQLSALEVIQALLSPFTSPPTTGAEVHISTATPTTSVPVPTRTEAASSATSTGAALRYATNPIACITIAINSTKGRTIICSVFAFLVTNCVLFSIDFIDIFGV